MTTGVVTSLASMPTAPVDRMVTAYAPKPTIRVNDQCSNEDDRHTDQNESQRQPDAIEQQSILILDGPYPKACRLRLKSRQTSLPLVATAMRGRGNAK
jgi:hypothetical protein